MGCRWWIGFITAASVFLIKKAPSGFIPTEDQGFILYAVNTPPGSSLERTHKQQNKSIKSSTVKKRKITFGLQTV
jgi:multidrug efflux pump subunit AcrB